MEGSHPILAWAMNPTVTKSFHAGQLHSPTVRLVIITLRLIKTWFWVLGGRSFLLQEGK